MIDLIVESPPLQFYAMMLILAVIGLSLHVPAALWRKWLGLPRKDKNEHEHKFMAEERARRRYAAADEVTRIRTILIDKKATREEKRQAFHGAQYHSDNFWHEDQFVDAWEEFYAACNAVYHAWIKWDASSKTDMARLRARRERELEEATFVLNQKASHLRATVLRSLG